MSRNSVILSFSAPNTYKKYADQIIDLVNSERLVSPALEHMYEVEKCEHSHTFDSNARRRNPGIVSDLAVNEGLPLWRVFY